MRIFGLTKRARLDKAAKALAAQLQRDYGGRSGFGEAQVKGSIQRLGLSAAYEAQLVQLFCHSEDGRRYFGRMRGDRVLPEGSCGGGGDGGD